MDGFLKEQDMADEMLTFPLAGGDANAILLDIPKLVDRYFKTFIASADNGGAATTINEKPLYKPGTTTAPTLKAGKAYTVWYSLAGNCFFIKASAEGTATAAQVLAGVPFSNQDDTGIVGIMPNRAGDTACIASSVSGTTLKLRASEGYRDGIDDNVTITDADFIAANIVENKNVFGLDGKAQPYVLTAGNNVMIANDDYVSSTNTTPAKIREYQMKYSGTVRVTFTLMPGYGYYGYGQVYINGVAKGTLRSQYSNQEYTSSQDFTVNVGDRVQIYGYCQSGSYQIKNFRLCAANTIASITL